MVAVVAALVLHLDAKSRVEAIASDALQMDVTVGQRPEIGFLPSLHIALGDVHVRNHGAEVATAGEVDLRIELMPLLHHEIRIEKVALKRLALTIERDPAGRLNIDRSSTTPGSFPPLAITTASVSDASLSIVDKQSGRRLELTGCTLDVSRLQFSSGPGAAFLPSLSLAAKGICGQIRTTDVTVSDVRFSVAGENGVLDADPVTMRLFGGQGSGTVRADLTGAAPVYHVRYRLTQFRIEEFFKTVSPKSIGQGPMDFSADLSLRGTTTDALIRTSVGEASLHGANLKLYIGDVDKASSRYKASQKFNLVDVAAVFFAGPLGLGVTKGYDFARIFQGTGESTTVRTLISEWQVEHGVAEAKDVAMATPENRVALKGRLDFVTGRFEDVTVAIVNAKGCPEVQQKVRGSFLKPVVEEPNVVATLTGPTRTLVRQAKKLFGGKCDVFYTGSVAPPQ